MIYLYIALGIFVFWGLLCFAAMIPSMKKNPTVEKLGTTVFAHRGLHDKGLNIPENSLAAFKRSADNGFGAEFDVRLSKDLKPVIMHDSTVDRMTGTHGKINEMTGEKLSGLKLGGTEERIPLLKDVLELVNGRVPLLIELKTDGGNYIKLCRECFKLLDHYKGDYAVESFDPRVLWWMRRNRPNVGRGQLAAGEGISPLIFKIILKHLCLNFLSKPHFIAYDTRHIEKTCAPVICNKLFGCRLYAWTVTDNKTLKKYRSSEISSIFEGFIPK